MRAGSPWRDLPEEHGHWQWSFACFPRWRENGVWERVATALSGEAGQDQLCIESSICCA